MDWYELLPKILNMSLTASVIIVTVLILRVLLRRAPRIYSYMLWAVVLFRLLCPITINTPLSVLGLFDTPIVETTDSVSQVAYIPNNIVHTENPEVTLPVPVLDNATRGGTACSRSFGGACRHCNLYMAGWKRGYDRR